MLYISIPLYVYIYIYICLIYTHLCAYVYVCMTQWESVGSQLSHIAFACIGLPCWFWLHVPLMYIYTIYIHICLLYKSDHSHTQVCIEGGSCPDGCETQPYYRMDVWQYLHWWTLLWLYALSHCKKNHVSHCCNCMTICRLRSFIEALIQLTTHTASHNLISHKMHHITSQHAPHVQYMMDDRVYVIIF